jgi:pimeloyl-ACP methyl ester carboxylesterase/DNA-binding winged helix-turn-helix (wHTH) protein
MTGAEKVYLIGPFRLEVHERRLLRDGDAVPLLGKAFDTLVLLVEKAGTLQTQDSLMSRLWPDVVVEPNNLQQNISLVRRALGGSDGVEIETVRGQGYRLLAEVREVETRAPREASRTSDAEPPGSVPRQRVHFCTAADKTRLAYARSGNGPPLVKAANWLSHIELEWNSPIWKHWLERLGRDRTLIRYDVRGSGLSDWRPPSITFPDFVRDLADIFDAGGVERAPLFGVSQGAAVSVAYAVQNPERVSALILVGGCARGWRAKRHPRLTERGEALLVLMRQGWGAAHPAFRQIFTTSFFPSATREQTDFFNELQRQTASPENAARIVSALGDLDIRDLLPRIEVPTLVAHSRGDKLVPFSDGVELAAGIKGARFLPLESENHLLLEHEPAWTRFDKELGEFLAEVDRREASSPRALRSATPH